MSPKLPTPDELEGPYHVTHVIDGDTIWIENADGQIEKIRFIGLDTPEKDEPCAKNATDYTASLLSEQMIYLERGEAPYDRYNRSLCYVFLDDQTTMINEAILAAGWAKQMTIAPNDKYAAHFNSVLNEAIKANKGLYQNK